MLRIARQAQSAANEHLSLDRRIVVLANNSDRQGNSYGGHQSFLMTRAAWEVELSYRSKRFSRASRPPGMSVDHDHASTRRSKR